jgi:two-component system, NarL family, response regulator
VDVHPLVRLGVRKVLSTDFLVQEATGREEALDLVRDIGDFDVAILDMGWRPNGNGASISGTETIREMRRAAPVLGIVAHGDRPERHLANAALVAGATAYVARTAGPEQLREAVAAAVAQEHFVDANVPPKGSRGSITKRQREILQLLADGESTTVAARQLGLSEETVKTHIKSTLSRLEAKNRSHAVAIGLRESLIV